MNHNTPTSPGNGDHFRQLKSDLDQVQETVQRIIQDSLQEIMKNPQDQKEIVSLWISCGQELIRYFTIEAEKSGKSDLGINIWKQIMFKR